MLIQVVRWVKWVHWATAARFLAVYYYYWGSTRDSKIPNAAIFNTMGVLASCGGKGDTIVVDKLNI